MRKPGFVLWLLVVGLVSSTACSPEPSGQASRKGAALSGPGEILFLTHCESCHGVEGRGDGRAAAYLRTPPADLTQLWKRHGTPLDREPLREYIDGRRLGPGQELREMPIWGEEFFADTPPGAAGVEDVRRRVIEVLIDHLESLQTEREL